MFRFQLSVAERLAHQPVVYSLRHMVQLFSIGRCCLLHDLTGEPFRIAGRRRHHVLGIRRAHRRIVIRSEEVGLSLLGRIVIRPEQVGLYLSWFMTRGTGHMAAEIPETFLEARSRSVRRCSALVIPDL